MKRAVIALALFVSLSPPVRAQETLPVPTRDEFVEQSCVPALKQQVGDSAEGLVFARAACECSYRLLSDKTAMTREQFDAASTVCRAEFEQDNAAFVRKYAH